MSHPFPAQVNRELEALGVADTPRLVFYNKADALPDDERQRLADAAATKKHCLVGSAKADLGLDALRAAIADVLDDALCGVRVAIPYADPNYGAFLTEVRARGRVDACDHGDDRTTLAASVPYDLAGRLRPYKDDGDDDE